MVSDACYEFTCLYVPGDLNLHVRILTVRWGWLGVGRSDNCPLSVEFEKRIKIRILLNKTVNTKEYLLIRLKEFAIISTESTLWAHFMGLVAAPHI